MDFDQHHLDTFWRFVAERQAIWHRRFELGQRRPWTDDPILHTFRFTNMYRDLDRGTVYAIERILKEDEKPQDKLFNLMLYRLIGRDDTHEELGFQRLKSFDPQHLERTLKRIRGRGDSPFTGAYMVSGYTQFGSKDKAENVAEIFRRIASGFEDFWVRIRAAEDSEAAYELLRTQPGFGSFLAFQVLVDARYPVIDGKPLLPFSNDDWAKAGPGAKRGVRLLRPGAKTADELPVMHWLRDHQESEFTRLGVEFHDIGKPLTLSDVQNCLCEYHKYAKITEGTGRARRTYP